MYDKKGNLTHEGAKFAIKTGGSVLHQGVLYSSLDTLPPAAAFAGTDPAKIQSAREDLIRRKKALEAEEEILTLAEESGSNLPPENAARSGEDKTPPAENDDGLDAPGMTKEVLLGIAVDEDVEVDSKATKDEIKKAIRDKRAGL